MKNKIAGTVAAGIAALLIPAVSVQAVTVNFGTAATVSSDSIQGWPKGPDTVSETAVLIDADTGAVLYDKGKDEDVYKRQGLYPGRAGTGHHTGGRTVF